MVHTALQVKGWAPPKLPGSNAQWWSLSAPFPERGLVYDVCYSAVERRWKPWTESLPTFEIAEDQTFNSIVVPTLYTAQFDYLLTLLVTHDKPVLVCGATGTGKSAYTQNTLAQLPREHYMRIGIAFSARTTALQTQTMMEDKLERRKGRALGPPGGKAKSGTGSGKGGKGGGSGGSGGGGGFGKRGVVFVDDLNMPEAEEYGAQPPIELLRQLLDSGGWYDHSDRKFMRIVGIQLVAAMGTGSLGRGQVAPRLLRHFNTLCFVEFDDATLCDLFGTIVGWHVNNYDFPQDVISLVPRIIAATLAVYRRSMEQLLPTPAKSHYTFNLRDFSRVVQGMLLVDRPGERFGAADAIRLWVHECIRVFADRLVDDTDREWFLSLLRRSCSAEFNVSLEDLCRNLRKGGGSHPLSSHDMRGLLFGDFAPGDQYAAVHKPVVALLQQQQQQQQEQGQGGSGKAGEGEGEEVDSEDGSPAAAPAAAVDLDDSSGRQYRELCHPSNLLPVLTGYLAAYNEQSRKPMSLVMFLFAIEHVSRICRVLRMQGGHALLVGVGGSGKQSLTRLAAFMSEQRLVQVEISKGYGTAEWHDDLRTLLRDAGCGNLQVVLLFSDTQIKQEGFVEDINNILNAGEVPGLFPPEEKLPICDAMIPFAQAMGEKGEGMDFTDLFNLFVSRVRENLHVVLAFSPVGTAFRERLHKFPSLVNCCTIDWFAAWPADALVAVAQQFLDEVEMSARARTGIVALCQHFHSSVRRMSEEYRRVRRRHNYVTPTSYLNLITTFKQSLSRKRQQVLKSRRRYEVGLEKLEFATAQVNAMQAELEALQPVLRKSQGEASALMDAIEKKMPGIRAIRKTVAAEAAVAQGEADQCNAMKEECSAELAKALPLLQDAIRALNTIKPTEISEVKVMQNPPQGVRLVLEAVCVMLSEKPERVVDPNDMTKKILDWWPTSKKLLTDPRFIQRLKEYDKDNIPPRVVAQIRRRYCPDENFRPQKVRKSSAAAMGLCKWVLAMEAYDRVAKDVAPKRAALEEAEAQLAGTMAGLKKKQDALQTVEDELAELQAQLDGAQAKRDGLAQQVELCGQKLRRAVQLISSLGGEKARWGDSVTNLSIDYTNATGDVLVSAAVIAYLGAFGGEFRTRALTDWVALCRQREVPCSADPSLSATLGDPVVIQQWHLNGLPTDSFSVDNGLVVYNARRWPLMIDPQGQANKWVRAMERDNKLRVMKLTDGDYLRTLENAVQYGQPVLLENVGEELDPALEPLLAKNTFLSGGVLSIQLGDTVIEYSPDFRFYITTSLRNPHYLPEVTVQVTLINFMITPHGLEDQLLGIVVARERPDLEQEKNALIVSGAENKRKLKEIEDRILQVLSEGEGNILEDETGINVLNNAKALADDIRDKEAVAAETEKQIDAVRMGYKSVAFHAQLLFFCIADLALIDPMYQYSLSWFLHLFVTSIDNSPRSRKLSQRLQFLNEHFTDSLYRNVCRSLFEKDKLLFAFLLCNSILRGAGKVDSAEWYFLLTGGVAMDNVHSNPAARWLSGKQWGELCRLSDLPAFSGLREHFVENLMPWRMMYESSIIDAASVPLPWRDSLTPYQKLLLLRCLRPDKVVGAVREFVASEMGDNFVKPPPFDLAACYPDSTVSSPLIFILSPGSDPMASLLRFAEHRGTRVDSISLGQGQGPIAERMIFNARQKGSWVVLQNCHLAVSWLPKLEKICEGVDSDNTEEGYRLWITSYPSDKFPVSLLQSGVKMTNEPPKGLRANIMSSYRSDTIADPEFFNSLVGEKGVVFRRLLFGLCFFHAVVQERRQFGALGWNIPYEFNDSDLRISARQLAMFLGEQDGSSSGSGGGGDGVGGIPYDALRYCAGECNYGGRVTDDKDRRLLNHILDRFYCPDVLTEGHALSSDGKYVVPPDGSHEYYLDFSGSLPLVAPPEVLGLHPNATIAKDQNETFALFRSILLTQASASGGDGGSGGGGGDGDSGGEDSGGGGGGGGGGQDAVVEGVAADIASKLPANFNLEAAHIKYPIRWRESMNTVLVQELLRFNALLTTIRDSLATVRKALAGLVVMTPELRTFSTSLFYGRVPQMWRARSYPTLKALSGYVSDLLQRIAFFADWLAHAPPPVFWLSGFYFTQSFLTGALQNYARAHSVAIDDVRFDFQAMPRAQYSSPPKDGVYIRGLVLEGARWDKETSLLQESQPKVLFSPAPILWLKPCPSAELSQFPHYECPVYKTSERRGTLSTTGHSTNFVMMVKLPSDQPSSFWVQRGVAMLTQLDD